MSPTYGTLAMLIAFPLALASVFTFAKSLPLRLAVWFSAGWLLSQWLHVMLVVSTDKIAKKSEPTFVQVAYFFRIRSWHALLAAVVFGGILTVLLHRLCRDADTLSLSRIAFVTASAVGLSQLIGSGYPKLGGEAALAMFLLAGVLMNHYFMTYAPGAPPPAAQVQSDALTTFALVIGLVSLWWPMALGFGQFLYRDYFSTQPLMAQFQMVRYGAYVAWTLVGIGLVAWRSLELLVQARKGAL